MRSLDELKAALAGTVSVNYENNSQYVTVNGRTLRFGEAATVEQIRNAFAGIPPMSVIDRIKQKALEARNIAPAAIKAFESDLDALIAEGPKLHADKNAAVRKHQEAFKGIRDQFDGLHSAIDILSNGGDPLDESKS